MARRDHRRLAVLLKLAELRERGAARALGEINGQLQAAQQQVDLLADYQLEYAQRLRQQAATGVSPRTLRNYDRFCGTLSGARDRQLSVVAETEQRREQIREAWSERYARRRLLEQMHERRQREAEKWLEDRLQAEQDDLRRGTDATEHGGDPV